MMTLPAGSTRRPAILSIHPPTPRTQQPPKKINKINQKQAANTTNDTPPPLPLPLPPKKAGTPPLSHTHSTKQNNRCPRGASSPPPRSPSPRGTSGPATFTSAGARAARTRPSTGSPTGRGACVLRPPLPATAPSPRPSHTHLNMNIYILSIHLGATPACCAAWASRRGRRAWRGRRWASTRTRAPVGRLSGWAVLAS